MTTTVTVTLARARRMRYRVWCGTLALMLAFIAAQPWLLNWRPRSAETLWDLPAPHFRGTPVLFCQR
ncbi:MAG: hypothetical protein JWQ95_3727 [Sphaerisporangium sp.]|nr:hypothetical protein [Sphaerisporangium sp.]